jgi:NPCBM/NEW2 domain-containing protein
MREFIRRWQLFFSLLGVVMSVITFVSPQDLTSNASKWIKEVGFNPPMWLEGKTADAVLRAISLTVLIALLISFFLPFIAHASSAVFKKRVYLADLPEQDVRVGWGNLGKNGDMGHGGERVYAGNLSSHHSLSMHPPTRGSSHVAYDLPVGFRLFSAAAFNNAPGPSDTPLVFKVLGDGLQLWSTFLEQNRQPVPFSVDITGIKHLQLEVICDGSNGRAHAVWIDPVLT